MCENGARNVVIRFSSRENGNCAAIAKEIRAYFGDESTKVFAVDAAVSTPCGGCDYECLRPEKVCPNVSKQQVEIMDAICAAECVYYIVPNFCGYPASSYFAFNEKSVGYFNMDRALMGKYMSVPKRFIIVSNTEGDSFTNAMRQQTNKEPEMLYMKTGKYKKRSIAGDILESDEAMADLRAFLDK